MTTILSIAGSDSSAGAGIQQDLKTITAHHAYAATAITAITSQNTLGVQSVMPIPADVVQSQITSVLDDLDVQAIKIGQIPNAEVAHAIVTAITQHYHSHQVVLPIVYDPVMISTSGRRLMSADSILTIQSELFPLCTLITPNIPEAEHLLQRELMCDADIIEAGEELVNLHSTNFLIKGGHAEGNTMTDRLFTINGNTYPIHSPRILTRNLHGTGCTLSSAIACQLAQGKSLLDAIGLAKQFVYDSISRAQHLNIGHGNGPLWCFED